MKYIFSSIILSLLIISSFVTTAQSMATKKIIAKYESDYIPEFKESIAYRSNNPALGKIEINMDFESFGDNTAELDLAVRELNMVKGAILFLAKDAVGKASIEKGIKKITIRKVEDVSKKGIDLTGNNLTIATTSFDLKTLIGSAEIQKFLEKNL
ncbi:MAG: hypothetical protein WKF35_04400 [Ferruginibacter sp.]